VETNDADHVKETLTCRGRFLEGVHAEPADAYFGRINASAATMSRTITLTRGDAGSIAPKLIPLEVPGLYAQLCEIEPGELYELEVSLSPPWKGGRIQQKLQLETGVEETPVMDVWVRGQVTAD